MTGNRFIRRPGTFSPEPKFGRMLGASLLLHLVVVLVFTGVLIPRMKSEPRPVYVVDLVNLPVANPQAGRPDATPKQKPAPPAPKPKPVVKPKPKAAAKPAPKPKPVVKPKPQSAAKPEIKPTPKADYRDAVSAIEKLKRQKEIEQLKQSLSAMATQDTRQAEAVKAPLGEVTGSGTEAGVGRQTWLQAYYKQAWSLSKYQVSQLDLAATIQVVFDARGYLKDYRVIEKSGDQRFDDSVTQAVRSLEQLPTEPGRQVEYTIHFNLKELMEQ